MTNRGESPWITVYQYSPPTYLNTDAHEGECEDDDNEDDNGSEDDGCDGNRDDDDVNDDDCVDDENNDDNKNINYDYDEVIIIIITFNDQ